MIFPADSSCGVLLVGHGTREPAGQAQFFELAGLLARVRPDWACEACFLELAPPDIRLGMARLVDRGARRVVVMPLLLFAAGHARQDIPAAVAEAAAGLAPLQICYAEPLGCHAALVALSAQRCLTALAEDDGPERDDPLLLAVGRGSSDASAVATMRRYAQLVAERLPVCGVETCFLEKAEPTFDAGLARAAEAAPRAIVVLPHLLFSGQLLDDVGRRVDVWRLRAADRRWLLADSLGPDPAVIRVVVERIAEALAAPS